MFKKIILSMVLACSLGASATGMDMAEGFNGSFELKYNHTGSGSGIENTTYRARAGWTGTANDIVGWGFNLSTETNASFGGGYNLNAIGLEQAWLSIAPMQGFKIMLGKFQMNYSRNVFGNLYDDDYYAHGMKAMYAHRINAGTKGYLQVSHTGLSETTTTVPTIAKGLGRSVGISIPKSSTTTTFVSRATVGVKSVMNALRINAGVGFESTDLSTLVDTGYGRGFLSIGTRQMGMPLGIFGMYSTGLATPFDSETYTGGVWLGEATGSQDFSVHVSYYNVSKDTWHTNLIDTDYMEADAGTGVNLRGQYNLMDNISAVAKVSHNLDDSSQSIIGELTTTF